MSFAWAQRKGAHLPFDAPRDDPSPPGADPLIAEFVQAGAEGSRLVLRGEGWPRGERAAQDDSGAPQVRLQFIKRGFDLPAFVVERGQFGGRGRVGRPSVGRVVRRLFSSALAVGKRERYDPVAGCPDPGTPPCDNDDELLSVHDIRHGRSLPTGRKLMLPELAASIDVERPEDTVLRRRSEHQSATGQERPSEYDRTPLAVVAVATEPRHSSERAAPPDGCLGF